ncbi:MAG: hypothetical protein WC783_00770 [Candidatus Paceibacterota bacterium]|jgi:hypothetical protein
MSDEQFQKYKKISNRLNLDDRKYVHTTKHVTTEETTPVESVYINPDGPEITSFTRDGYWLKITGKRFDPLDLDPSLIFIRDRNKKLVKPKGSFPLIYGDFEEVSPAFFKYISPTEMWLSMKYMKSGYTFEFYIRAKSIDSKIFEYTV